MIFAYGFLTWLISSLIQLTKLSGLYIFSRIYQKRNFTKR